MKTEIIWFILMAIVILYVLLFSCEIEHWTAAEELAIRTSGEAIQNVASLFDSANMTVSNINVTQNATVLGKLYADDEIIMNGDNSWLIQTPPGEKKLYIVPKKGNDWDFANKITIDENGGIIGLSVRAAHNVNTPLLTADGRVHIGGPELLFLLNKSGVIVGKEWGGNGNLSVQGSASVQENLSVQGTTQINGRFIKRFDNIRSGDGGDLGGVKNNIANDTDCKNVCLEVPGAYTALYDRARKQCWCKNHVNMRGSDPNWVTWWIN